ncbi:hypothetical protein EAF07_08775 [Streptococcus hillyeri]|uniref:Uncharacterized protein n=1 Tax=Streptococcus hillyeri TaxID=2282420 RepID=A0A3L9DJW3_9STRE|nr:hypothetical protein EAF07_08775 [Streptococcus hillyeri]
MRVIAIGNLITFLKRNDKLVYLVFKRYTKIKYARLKQGIQSRLFMVIAIWAVVVGRMVKKFII